MPFRVYLEHPGPPGCRKPHDGTVNGPNRLSGRFSPGLSGGRVLRGLSIRVGVSFGKHIYRLRTPLRQSAQLIHRSRAGPAGPAPRVSIGKQYGANSVPLSGHHWHRTWSTVRRVHRRRASGCHSAWRCLLYERRQPNDMDLSPLGFGASKAADSDAKDLSDSTVTLKAATLA